MTDIRFRDLTPEQKDFICNGCGGKGGWIQPPNFFFKADCNHHDFNYWLGCTEADRKTADKQFHAAMREDVKSQPWYKRPLFYVIAWTYYRAVRFSGKKFFYYGPSMRTKEDLLEQMKKA
jgi:hypothetical protein